MVSRDFRRIAIVILAAGKSSRMGGGNHKLLAEFDGVPLVRRSVVTALESDAASVILVTGYRSDEIEDAVSNLSVETARNNEFASGMASSIKVGFATKGVEAADGALVMLADMPAVTSGHLNMLMEAFNRTDGSVVIRSVSAGKRGNPVILPKALFDTIPSLQGDVGARGIIESSNLPVIDVDIGNAAEIDVDTPADLSAAGGILADVA